MNPMDISMLSLHAIWWLLSLYTWVVVLVNVVESDDICNKNNVILSMVFSGGFILLHHPFNH